MDQTDAGLKAVMKALTDVVQPALDPDDPLAGEQLRLAVEYVSFVRERIDYLHSRERYDLTHYIDLAKAIFEAGAPSDSETGRYLVDALDQGEKLKDSASARTDQLRAASMELAHAISGMVRAAVELQPDVSKRVNRLVLDASGPKLEFELHWYAPVGFDPDLPKDVELTDFFR